MNYLAGGPKIPCSRVCTHLEQRERSVILESTLQSKPPASRVISLQFRSKQHVRLIVVHRHFPHLTNRQGREGATVTRPEKAAAPAPPPTPPGDVSVTRRRSALAACWPSRMFPTKWNRRSPAARHRHHRFSESEGKGGGRLYTKRPKYTPNCTSKKLLLTKQRYCPTIKHKLKPDRIFVPGELLRQFHHAEDRCIRFRMRRSAHCYRVVVHTHTNAEGRRVG